ncbi:hypothetical protein JTB14_008760 [Gonioctena quinquepunctata]|nr:hypothetical protein JTB14_008760 [Gonioctena quinquepunctata]
MSKYWELEEIPPKTPSTSDEELAEQNFSNTHNRLENGRIQVKIPSRSPTETQRLGESLFITKKAIPSIRKKPTEKSTILYTREVSGEDLMLEIDCCQGYEKKFIDLRITYGNRQKHVDIGLDEDDRRSRASLAVS